MTNNPPTLRTAIDLLLEQVQESNPPRSINEAIGLIVIQLQALGLELIKDQEQQDAEALLQQLLQIAANAVSAVGAHVLPILEEETR
jgi:hypothetical protein